MSLRDTIEGARREAEGNSVGRPKKEAESVVAAGDEERKGFSRSSAAKAKPSREAAASVRVATKPKQGGAPGGPAETKEQKRAEAEARAELNRRLKSRRTRLATLEKNLERDRARYDELMALMASEELYADQERFNAALAEYNDLKKKIADAEDEWLELSTEIEEEIARGCA